MCKTTCRSVAYFFAETEKLLLDGDDDVTVLQKTTLFTENVMAIQVCPQSF